MEDAVAIHTDVGGYAPNIRVNRNRIFHSSSVMFGYSEPTLGPMAPSIWLSHFSAIL